MKHKLLAPVLVSMLCGSVLRSQSTHTITFTFDYDFKITPACSPTVKEKCVEQFNFYDISAGIPKRVKLGSFAVPPGSAGLVKGMSVTTKPLLFNPGRHMFAVSAQMPNGRESDLGECTTIVKIA
ncbi:MAG TPA: hypothetical protein VI431_12570 [Candidatus Acidoferrum sp.]